MDIENEVLKLVTNRLMETEEEIEKFEEAMNILYSKNNIENITFYCKAFDDKTHEPSVMFSLIHGIENYDTIFGKEESTSKFLDSIKFMVPHATEWLETMILRILNDTPSRKVFIAELKNKKTDTKKIVKKIIQGLIQRNPQKFEATGNEVLYQLI